MEIKDTAKKLLPPSVYKSLQEWWNKPRYKPVNWKKLRRLTPLSNCFGLDRGKPIDRYYIEQFLGSNASDIQGNILEIGGNTYTYKFGGDRVAKSDVLHLVEGNPLGTIIADLTQGDNIPSDYFDCIVCTQTLIFIYDVKAAIKTLHRILKPGGILLVTLTGLGQISRYDMDRWGEYWRFTSQSGQMLFSELFSSENVTVKIYGNVLTATALIQGIVAQELTESELNYQDHNYELIIGVRAVKT